MPDAQADSQEGRHTTNGPERKRIEAKATKGTGDWVADKNPEHVTVLVTNSELSIRGF